MGGCAVVLVRSSCGGDVWARIEYRTGRPARQVWRQIQQHKEGGNAVGCVWCREKEMRDYKARSCFSTWRKMYSSTQEIVVQPRWKILVPLK